MSKNSNNKLNKMEKITKENFEAYVDVQESGVTNMFNVKLVNFSSSSLKGVAQSSSP